MTENPVVRMTRTIPAPPDRVYRAWLDPEIISRWFAPADYTVIGVEVDERIGGRHSVRQADPKGTDVGGFESELLELVPDRRIVFRVGFAGLEHVLASAIESQLTIELEPTGDGRTELTLVHERLDGLRAAMPDVAANVAAGWEQALAKLAEEVSA